jgi:hypothetical protein
MRARLARHCSGVIALTVPASFDAVARELAEVPDLTLLAGRPWLGAALLLHAPGKIETVHLPDHGVAGDAGAEPSGDLAGAQSGDIGRSQRAHLAGG